MGQKKKISITVATSANYTLTNAFAIVAPATGSALTIACPKTGYYNLKTSFCFNAIANGDNCFAYIAVNTLKHSFVLGFYSAAGGTIYAPITICNDYVYLKKGDIISVYATYTDAGGAIPYAAGYMEPYLQITEV